MPGCRKKVAPVRGSRVRFIAGVYKEKEGWLNAAKTPTTHNTFVIVDEGQAATEDAEYATHVKKSSYVTRPDTQATTIEEYLVQEDLKVAHNIAKLAESIAEAGVKEATMELLMIIQVCINMACEAQRKKGSKAKYSATALKLASMMTVVEQQDDMFHDPTP